MKQKRAYSITKIDELELKDFPVVDIFTHDGRRLGCATNVMVNLTILMGLLTRDEKLSELALEFERELKVKSGVTNRADLLNVLTDWTQKHDLESLSFIGDRPSVYFLLFLLINDFYLLIQNESKSGEISHLDVIYCDKDTKKICFNAWELNEDQLETFISSSLSLWAFRNQRTLGPAFITKKQLLKLTVTLTSEQKRYLQEFERNLLEKEFFDLLTREEFINFPLQYLFDEKIRLLKSLKFLSDHQLILL